jgi:hypothetical protein
MSDAPETSQPETTDEDPTVDEHGETALEHTEKAIHEARDAGGSVAASGDITTLDDQRAGEYSEDPGGEGGHP